MAGAIRRGAGLAALLAAAAAPALAGPAESGPINSVLSGAIAPVHDPVLVREGSTYYVFGTGLGGAGGQILSGRRSPDLRRWTVAPPAVTLPGWAVRAIPDAKSMWAPDLSFWNGRWHLYYAVSSFGSNRSAIGLMTSPTLDPAKPGYGWRDEGLAVQSTPADDFNAIDPAHIEDASGRHWLALGSFWSGIKLFALDGQTGKPRDPAAPPIALARRPVPAGAPDPIEAPFLIRHGDYYYLFASYDYCCKGVNSTYYTVVGRARLVTGPYLGKDGSRMLEGGGTVILRGDLREQQRFRGPGHNGFLHDADGRDYLVYHAYDKAAHGAPTLRISPVRWTADGWPEAVD
ncbi:arabinan endo-1,5-alpha-L-arabinosidase [Sphingomonas morindae]|uniref:Extracellular exo-alpha-(1->5)-L-arabinofuranosidase n=1 Tax=Sphingomonas morindae TaxID=1541170 RepID=A0ABY4XCW6_9SPHN|nr:arabinan endo-1,5-alpha-L-arabinosidase [Sphingomonas morindae]USI74742.1 arabinan endo-1,5-alpha-L-arabinosidase [Sphingomonas morindae]